MSNQQLENLSWFEDEGEEKKLFVSAHNDGSYVVWDIENGQKPKKEATTPYGPFPCKRIEKIRFWKDEDGEQMCAFNGGMPRAAYGDHFTVTIKAEGKKALPSLKKLHWHYFRKLIVVFETYRIIGGTSRNIRLDIQSCRFCSSLSIK